MDCAYYYAAVAAGWTAVSMIRQIAFADWVPDFVAWTNRQSGLHRTATAAEVAAHRGLLARGSLDMSHVAMFLYHAVGENIGQNGSSEPLSAFVRTLSEHEVDADGWLLRFLRDRPLTKGNGRCGRALWLWRTSFGEPATAFRWSEPVSWQTAHAGANRLQ